MALSCRFITVRPSPSFCHTFVGQRRPHKTPISPRIWHICFQTFSPDIWKRLQCLEKGRLIKQFPQKREKQSRLSKIPSHHEQNWGNLTCHFFPCIEHRLFFFVSSSGRLSCKSSWSLRAERHREITADSSQPGHTLVRRPPLHWGGQHRHRNSLLLQGALV